MTAEVEVKKDQKAERTTRRSDIGVVVSAGRDKTIKVHVERLNKHPRYNKYIRRRTTMHVHDEKNEAAEGDRVEIMECRPISKQKNWRLVRVVRRSSKASVASEELNS